MRLLCVTAHPDDEAASFGGTLRLYHERGVDTSLLCLTPGQAASNRGATRSDKELSAVRKKELAASCDLLGIREHLVLDYSDGKLHRLDLYRIVDDITRSIRHFRPHVVLTFGPEGAVTAHTDHAMVSIFTTLAFQWSAHSNRYPDQFNDGLEPHRAQKLYYATANFTMDGRQPIAPPPATAVIQIGEYLDTKVAAFQAHTTQSPVFPTVIPKILARGREERFHLVARSEPSDIKMESDLFEGVRDDEVSNYH
jgi:LmbE family N-acetylglucosaminyl deacetylase